MRPTCRGFTIRGLMIGVGSVAVLLVLVRSWNPLALLALPCLALIGAAWLVHRGRRRAAALGFWGLAILANVAWAAYCAAPNLYLLVPLFVGWAVIVLPAVGALGAAWVRLATRPTAVPRRSAPLLVMIVIALTLLPCLTFLTLWPLRLAFFLSRPALDRLADQTAAGKPVRSPQWAGSFRVTLSGHDPASGYVELMIDPEIKGPTWLFRIRPAEAGDSRHPGIEPTFSCRELRGGWWYRTDD